jgi:prepilin-type processing-associated H-X9-DG protein
MPYVKNDKAYLCPKGKPGQRSHYAFNARLAGKGMKDVQTLAETVLIFETDGGWNVSGGPELLPAKPRHSNGYVIGFADGHSEVVRPARLEKLRWEP